MAIEVARILNTHRHVNGQGPSHQRTTEMPFAVCVSMDGFHYPRVVLDNLPNKQEAYLRRGAPWTFDVNSILSFAWQLREWAYRGHTTKAAADKEYPILAPSFDHAAKDPIADSISIPPGTSIVILEGNYLLFDEPYWRGIPNLMDLRVFVDVDPQIARQRVARRHVEAGIEKNLEDAYMRFDANDALNGELVRQKLCQVIDVLVESLEDDAIRR
jgi:pantothenate kinase